MKTPEEIITEIRLLLTELEAVILGVPVIIPEPVDPKIYVRDKTKIYDVNIYGNDSWYPYNAIGYGSPEAYAKAIKLNWTLWKMGTDQALPEPAAFYKDWPQFFE